MCDVLVRLREGEALTEKERVIHDEGLVSVLEQIHDDLPGTRAAKKKSTVAKISPWPKTLTEQVAVVQFFRANKQFPG